MSTVFKFKREDINAKNPIISQTRTTIETAFYGNNVTDVKNLKEAYELAFNALGTVITDMPVYKPEAIGLEEGSKVLLFNDGDVSARCADARRILGWPGVSEGDYAAKVREAVYMARYKKLYHLQAYIGLDKDFMVKAHLLIPQGHENIAYNWMLNFQYINSEYIDMYEASKLMENEGDIFVFSDPDWKHEEHPMGLTLFDPNHNCAALLGMRYFGEHKKGTLTLAWGCANRNGFASCHAGQKRYNLKNGRKFVAGVFGLSGSGKSTITHAKHDNKYDVTVLHDDAFVISTENGSSVALEPSYFDKTQDYPTSSEDNKYLLTAQNCGATVDENGDVVLVTEDIRNGNGRAIKSKLWAPNRVDKFGEPVNAIFWIMKDPTLPPILKIESSTLAASMGATLATKRSTAERLAPGVDPNALVIEPYANPFRTYPLADDFEKFKSLFENRGVSCYILNTGFFMDKKIPKEITLDAIEKVIEDSADFKKWGPFKNISIMDIEGFVPDMNDKEYLNELSDRINDRVNFISKKSTENQGFDKLPNEAHESMLEIMGEIAKLSGRNTLDINA